MRTRSSVAAFVALVVSACLGACGGTRPQLLYVVEEGRSLPEGESGDVFVERGGDRLNGEVGMELEPGDRVEVGAGVEAAGVRGPSIRSTAFGETALRLGEAEVTQEGGVALHEAGEAGRVRTDVVDVTHGDASYVVELDARGAVVTVLRGSCTVGSATGEFDPLPLEPGQELEVLNDGRLSPERNVPANELNEWVALTNRMLQRAGRDERIVPHTAGLAAPDAQRALLGADMDFNKLFITEGTEPLGSIVKQEPPAARAAAAAWWSTSTSARWRPACRP